MKNTILTILTGLSVPAGFAVTKAILGTVGVGVSVYVKKSCYYYLFF